MFYITLHIGQALLGVTTISANEVGKVM